MRRAFLLLLLLLVAGCRPAWTLEVVGSAGTLYVDRGTFETLADFVSEVEGQAALPLERLLYVAGEELVAEVVLAEEGRAAQRFAWAEVAAGAWLLHDGRLRVHGAPMAAARIEGVAAPRQVEARITDIAPTAAAALGLPAPAQAAGRALTTERAAHVLIVLVDGFGYLRYQEAVEMGDAPFFASLAPPLRGMTIYPPVTVVAMGSLLTGAPPEVHGVTRRGMGRTTAVETLFDVAANAGLRVVAVEGYAVPFGLRNAEIVLSGDRDGDGFTDDNVLDNALAVLEAGAPELLFVHFHGIDDAGHDVGPGAPAERAAVTRVDAAVQALVEALPPDTLVLILADHGMHVTEGGGDHGHLIERDMLIPIFVFRIDG